jgi:crotonobetainyl-CoA:carnitine CoA-transferase CaiB-like acyl-CoA transferase
MRGVRVLEVGASLPSAYCGRLFATGGSDVVVLESPQGAPLRSAPPFVTDKGGQPRSALWEYLMAGKRSVAVELDDPAVTALLRWADLVITSSDGSPDDVVRFSQQVFDANPAAVVTAISGFGLTGPYRSWRSSALGDWASGGHLFLTGEPDREPLQGGGPWNTYLAGATAAVGSAAAVMHAARTGEGQLLDIGVMEAAASCHQWTVTMYTHIGCVKRRWGNLLAESTHPIALYRCRDGFISIVAVTQPQWESLCLAMELFDLLLDESLEVIGERFDRAAEIDEQINAWLAHYTVDEAVDYLKSKGVPVSRLLTMSKVLREPQLEQRDFLVHPPDFDAGAEMPWMPFRLEGREVAFLPAPRVGEHTAEVLARLDAPRDALPSIDLRNVRLLEFGVAWAGPLAGRLLGDLGADVVKIEHPSSRGMAPDRAYTKGWKWGELPHPRVRYGVFPDGDPGERWWNRMGMFNKMNRSKRGIALDAKTVEGAAILRRLITASDVVLNNYSPRGAQSLGLDPASVRIDNPLGITVCMSGYGAAGPLAANLSYGPVLQAHSGFDEATGYVDGPPARVGVAYPDAVGGVHGAFAILSALWERSLTGEPVHVDLSQLETLLAIAGEMLLTTSVTGQDPVRHGNRAEGVAPQNVYPCAGDDAWVAITVDTEDAWHALVDLVGDERLWRRRNASLDDRRVDHDTIDDIISTWTRAHTPLDIAKSLQTRGVIAVPVMTNRDLVENEHLVERGFVVVWDQPDVGLRGFPGSPLHFSRTPVRLTPCPALGQHNAAVLTEYLGLSDDDVAGLLDKGVIADRPPA